MQIHVDASNNFEFNHVVCDFNGTIAEDGELLSGVKERFKKLHTLGLQIWVITADTHGTAAQKLFDCTCELKIIGDTAQDHAKLEFIQDLNPQHVVAIGNGRNDCLMLKAARLGIAVMQVEGCAVDAIMAADIVVKNIDAALDLLIQPLRIKATMRL